MTKFQKKKCLEAAEQKTSKLLVVVCCCKTVEVKIALARGKKLYDKRADIAKKDQRREAQREFKVRNLG